MTSFPSKVARTMNLAGSLTSQESHYRFGPPSERKRTSEPTLLHVYQSALLLVLPDRMCLIYTFVSRDDRSGTLLQLCIKRTISCIGFVYFQWERRRSIINLKSISDEDYLRDIHETVTLKEQANLAAYARIATEPLYTSPVSLLFVSDALKVTRHIYL
jgi:hypothetical protein